MPFFSYFVHVIEKCEKVNDGGCTSIVLYLYQFILARDLYCSSPLGLHSIIVEKKHGIDKAHYLLLSLY